LDEFYFKLFNLNPFKLKKNIDHKWVRENTVIIHFCGEFKPWEENYPGKFGKLFYEKFADKVN
jgi:lipopolysaccharide biosynthesis glycosyltransferase